MAQEATVIILDNSEWSRNGDYSPSRLEAQVDAANLICGAKTQAHPENCCGIVTMAGKAGVRVLLSLTPDMGKILNATHGIAISGSSDLVSALKTSALVLKHRLNKQQSSRIVAFVCSPITHTSEELSAVAKQLRAANINVDIVNFGELEENTSKLEQFMEDVNKGASHLVPVPPGPHILSDLLVISPIIHPDGVVSTGAATSPAGMQDFLGIDPNNDPELAEAMRESMRSYEQDIQKQQPSTLPKDTTSGPITPVTTTVAPTADPTSPVPMESLDEDMDDELRQALAMSVVDTAAKSEPKTTSDAPPAQPTQTKTQEMEDDDELMALGLEMSLGRDKSESQPQQQPQPTQTTQPSQAFPLEEQDINALLMTLPGVDPKDPRIQEVLANLKNSENQNKNDSDKKEDETKDKQ